MHSPPVGLLHLVATRRLRMRKFTYVILFDERKTLVAAAPEMWGNPLKLAARVTGTPETFIVYSV